MKELWEFLASKYARLLLVPIVLAGILQLVVSLNEWPVPLYAVALAALVLTPQFWLGSILSIVLLTYVSSADVQGVETTEWGKAAEVLERSRRTYAWRERLSKPLLKTSVYFGYAVVFVALRGHGDRSDLNFHNTNWDESVANRQARNRALFHSIAAFVVDRGLHSQQVVRENQESGLEANPPSMLGSVPPTRHTQEVVRATYADGAGILSTVNIATLLHFVQTRPDGVRRQIIDAIESTPFDAHLFGWLGVRVIEAAVAMTVLDRESPAAVQRRLAPIVRRATAALESEPDARRRDAEKWSTRQELMRISRSR